MPCEKCEELNDTLKVVRGTLLDALSDIVSVSESVADVSSAARVYRAGFMVLHDMAGGAAVGPSGLEAVRVAHALCKVDKT
jgi:hypothetical protein